MYVINNKETSADIGYLEYRAQQLMSRGIKIGNIQSMYEYYNNLTNTLKEEITESYGIENVNSPKQITEYLSNLADRVELGARNDIIDICYDGDTGKWTSNAGAMEKLADLGYDIASDIMDYRKAKKYADSVKGMIDNADENGLVHPIVSLGKTNRVNYSKPGLMSLPKKLLWDLIAPINNEDVLYSVDIKNQEPSILINYLGDPELKKALLEDGGLYENLFKRVFVPVVEMNMVTDYLNENRVYSIDELRKIHFVEPAKYLPKLADCKSLYYKEKRVIAIETICHGYAKGCEIQYPETVAIETDDKQMHEIPVSWRKDFKPKKTGDFTVIGDLVGIEVNITKAERKEFKTAWNALSYGASLFGIRQMCKIINGDKIYRYFNSLESFKTYKRTIDKLVSQGVTGVTTVFGNIVQAGEADHKRLKRILLDLPIQGTGADILSCLIKHFDKVTKEKGIEDKAFLYYTRHDELIIEINKAWRDEIGKDAVEEFLRDTLEHQIICAGKEWIPFKVEVNELKPSELQLYDEDED